MGAILALLLATILPVVQISDT